MKNTVLIFLISILAIAGCSSQQNVKFHQEPDLIFMDIQLADGLSFEIFEQTIVKTPVIFTTAYDEYAIKAFKVNSIDYLLKPLDYAELKNAIDKFKENNFPKEIPVQVFDSIIQLLTKKYKNKFVMNAGEHIKVFTTDDIQCFYSMEKYTFLQNNSGRDYAISYSLDQLEDLLDPSIFFRINRKIIVSSSAISDIISLSNSRIKIKLNTNQSVDLIVKKCRISKMVGELIKKQASSGQANAPVFSCQGTLQPHRRPS